MKIQLSEVLTGKRTVALGGHVRPDGDCTGSSLGLYIYLKEQYPHIETDLYLEEIPKEYHILRRTGEIKHQIAAGKQYDLFICLDCGDAGRLGFSAPLFEQAAETLCIDHHVSNEAFADNNYIVPDASSTSELVFGLLDYEKISLPTAEALYMGIAHDTGVFQYPCTSPETMEAAAALMRKGIDGSNIIDKTYYEKTYVQNQILGRALLESILILNKKCIVSSVSKREMEFYGAGPSDLEGIVSQLRQTKGTEVALFMYELDTQQFKISLRSKGQVDVSVIAKYFGGGGHERAAGFTMNGSCHDVINNVGRQIELQLQTINTQVDAVC
ncbi:DHH family phosphoesterase [Luxibacter massiliensis]|uniref:DHH family phosphoesterase n=1 Tax=Luxibacter massiliensis TaxID=2219695 RepID=UPI000F05F873|nr:bifunctional oligoribonuclease/PAP phosphatase NrnA [Luxibacter massiliensis]